MFAYNVYITIQIMSMAMHPQEVAKDVIYDKNFVVA